MAGPGVGPAAVAVLRDDLLDADWTVDDVADMLGPMADAALDREQAVPALRATADLDDAAAVLTRLWVLGRPVPRAALDAALPRLGARGAATLALVADDGDDVRPLVDLRPHARGDLDTWVASDPGESAVGGPLPVGHVLGVGSASATLAEATIRRPVHRALDIGTGCGVQAIHLCSHSRRVTATDVDPRALAYARLNAGLAGLAGGQLELRRGSLLEPVAEDVFDLVVSNPPFVVTPRRADVPEYTYRDGGMVGDELCARLVRGLGEVLAPGGIAQLLACWEVRRGEAWDERPRAWVHGTDAWVVQRDLLDPAAYAELWIRDGGTRAGPEFDALYDAWLDDLESRDVEALGLGLVTLRQPATGGGPTLSRWEDERGPLHGEHLAAGLDAHDWLIARDDAALLASHLRVATDVTEERHHRPGAADPEVILLRQGGGFGRTVRAGTALAAVVGACDGELPLGTITAAVADLLQRSDGEVREEVLGDVRALVRDGLLRKPVDA